MILSKPCIFRINWTKERQSLLTATENGERINLFIYQNRFNKRNSSTSDQEMISEGMSVHSFNRIVFNYNVAL